MNTEQWNHHSLDSLLALQCVVAWAGEGRCEPARMGWWKTDLTDEEGGAYVLGQLLPQTGAWAKWECLRGAAVAAERRQRLQLPSPDHVRTLFYWGYDLDVALQGRMTALKLRGGDPVEVLPWPTRPEGFEREGFAAALSGLSPGVSFSASPLGRMLAPMAWEERPELAARALAAAVAPLASHWPMPFFRAPR